MKNSSKAKSCQDKQVFIQADERRRKFPVDGFAMLTCLVILTIRPIQVFAQDSNDTLCWQLHTAAYGNDTASFRMLLNDSTLDLECFFYGETNALGYAVQEGHYEFAEMLLQYGANPNGNPEIMFTPLCLAAEMGNLEIAELLILYGASPDLGDRLSLTPLLRAVHRNDYLMADMLLHYGAFPDTPMREGSTPLLIAALQQRYEIADLLLFKGANPSKADYRGFTPLMAAAASNDTLLGKILLNAGANPGDTTLAGWTPLAFAISNGSREMIWMLAPFQPKPYPLTFRKLVLHNLDRVNPSALRTIGLKPGYKPMPGWMVTSWGMSLTGNDIMYNYSLGIKELRYNTLVSAGFSHRGGTTAVHYQTDGNDTLLYQMSGRRRTVYTEIDKHIRIYGDHKRWLSLSAGIKPCFAWGSFDGSDKRPWRGFTSGAFGGIWLESRIFALYLRYMYLPLQDAPVSSGRFEYGINISFRGNRYQLKNKSMPYEFSY